MNKGQIEAKAAVSRTMQAELKAKIEPFLQRGDGNPLLETLSKERVDELLRRYEASIRALFAEMDEGAKRVREVGGAIKEILWTENIDRNKVPSIATARSDIETKARETKRNYNLV